MQTILLASAKEALNELGHHQTWVEEHPDGLLIVAVDFNQANLSLVLPKFHQYIDFASRRNNALKLVYTNISST